MNANFNFDLVFGNKNVLIRFSEDADARTETIGLHGRVFEAVSFCNAIGAILNVARPYYKVMEAGLYLHNDFETIRDGFADNNCGYAYSNRVEELIEKGHVSYRGEVVPNSLYRIRFDGALALFVSKMTIYEYTEGEASWVSHDRKAYNLVKNLEMMRKAQAKGVNIRLFFGEKEEPRMNLLAEHWQLYQDGKYEELAESISLHINQKIVNNTLYFSTKNQDKLIEEGKEPRQLKENATVRMFDGSMVEPKELLNKSVMFARGKVIMTGAVYALSTDKDLIAVMDAVKRGFTVLLTVNDQPVQQDAKPERKARKSTKRNELLPA